MTPSVTIRDARLIESARFDAADVEALSTFGRSFVPVESSAVDVALAAPCLPMFGTIARSASARSESEEQVGTASGSVLGGLPFRAKSPDVCRAKGWTLALVRKATGELTLATFRCRSWRCRDCAPAVNRRDAVRIAEALRKRPQDELVALVLTFDREALIARELAEHPYLERERAAARARHRAWVESRHTWKRLRDRLAYLYGETVRVQRPSKSGAPRWVNVHRKAVIDYVQTWEQHKKPWPHVNVVVHSPEIARDVRRRGSFEHEGRTLWRWANQVLRELALGAGFGPNVHAAPVYGDSDQLANYFAKCAAELTGSHRKDQAPIAAPRGFRRIRSTPKTALRPGFLEPQRVSTGEFVAELLNAPRELVELALDAGAQSLEHAGALARGALERCGFSVLARMIRDRAPPNSCVVT